MPGINNNDTLSYGGRVRVNGASGRGISRGGSGAHGSVTVETSKGTATSIGDDPVFRRRLDGYGPGKTPSSSKGTGRR